MKAAAGRHDEARCLQLRAKRVAGGARTATTGAKCSAGIAWLGTDSASRAPSLNSAHAAVLPDVRRLGAGDAPDRQVQPFACPLLGRPRLRRTAEIPRPRRAARRRHRHRPRPARRGRRARRGARSSRAALRRLAPAVRHSGIRQRPVRGRVEARRAALPAGRDGALGPARGLRARRHRCRAPTSGASTGSPRSPSARPSWRSSPPRASPMPSTSSTASTAWRRCAW